MSDVKKLIAGIALVVIGLVLFGSFGGNIVPVIGVIIGIIGLAMIAFVLTMGYL